ncbi:MAG: ATP-binding cassette domain-containing protein [bacterium]
MRRASVPYLRRNIGVVFQDFKLLYRRPVFDNVAFALEVLGLPRAEIRRRVTRVLHQVGLGTKLHLLPGRLSGGEQQRVAIARAPSSSPPSCWPTSPRATSTRRFTIDILNLFVDLNVRAPPSCWPPTTRPSCAATASALLTLEAGRLVEDSR